jgi:hypothetical protein
VLHDSIVQPTNIRSHDEKIRLHPWVTYMNSPCNVARPIEEA